VLPARRNMTDKTSEAMSASGEAREPGKCGVVALVGRPNAGKSTLLNRAIGEKVAIVSNKPQTTRTRISGVLTEPLGQIVFVDTPGVHKPGYELNRRMMHVVAEALATVDLVLLLVDASESSGSGEQFVIEMVKQAKTAAFFVPNKIDLLKDKSRLLPMIERYTGECQFEEVVPISAKTGSGVDALVRAIFKYLPEGPALYPDDTLTDQPERVLAAELVREKVLHVTGQELPFVTAVVTEGWEDQSDITRIHCVIYVERPSQRAIIIGKGGARLKQIGTAARADIEKLLGRHVFLGLFVKVRQEWRNDQGALDELGIQG
jgi:GTP-binding protein Era